MNLTIVIPTRNRNEQVQLLVQELKAMNCEIIVIDDCSERPVILDGAIVIRNLRKLGSGESRNIGCRHAKSDWLLLVDDDLIPSSGLTHWIQAHLPILDPRDIVGFRIAGFNNMGSSTVTYRYTTISRILNIVFGIDVSTHEGPSRFIPSAMIFNAKFFASLGGFDSRRYGGNGFREESDLQWRARKLGGRLTLIKDPFFNHLNIIGGHEKRFITNNIYFMRNQTIFALRTGSPAALVMISGFGGYLLAKGVRISTLVKGVALGVMMALKG